MTRRWRAAAGLLAVLVLAGCGGDSDNSADPGSSPGTPSGSQSPAPGVTGAPTGGGSGVPDACGLITTAELTTLLGMDPGTGESQSLSPDRSVCFYPSGTITAVEIAANYEASRALIEGDPSRTVTDVDGVGEAAFFDDLGGVAQFVAKGPTYFVAVTFVYESKESGVETGKQIAQIMLAAAEAQA